MQTEKELRQCLLILGQVSSDHGDGVSAAEILHAKMSRNGISYGGLLAHALRYPNSFNFVIRRFEKLERKAQRLWREKSKREEAEATAKAGEARLWKYDVKTDPGKDWTWVKSHVRYSSAGTEYVVRGHWRHAPRRNVTENWRKDPYANPGPEYEWIAGHTRRLRYRGRETTIKVRGYWREKATTLRKAA